MPGARPLRAQRTRPAPRRAAGNCDMAAAGIEPAQHSPGKAHRTRAPASQAGLRSFLVSAAYQSRPIASNRSIACSISVSSSRAKPSARRANGSRYVPGLASAGAASVGKCGKACSGREVDPGSRFAAVAVPA